MRDWVLLCADIGGHDQSGEFRELILFFMAQLNLSGFSLINLNSF